MENNRTLYLTRGWVTGIFLYYFMVSVVGIIAALVAIDFSLMMDSPPSTMTLAVIGSTGMAANGAAIFYIRKLYKLCFTESLCLDAVNENYIRRVGTIIYFLGRPFFSVGFSLLVVLGLQSGMMMATESPVELGQGFVHIAMFLSFFVGFLSGRFIKRLEIYGANIIDKITKAG